MRAKRNAAKKDQASSYGLKGKNTSNRNSKKRRTPALVPVPSGLALLIELVNLLPVQFRHPSWAIKNEKKRQSSKFLLYEEDILYWQFGAETKISIYLRDLNKEVPNRWRTNTPALLWSYLQAMLEEVPLSLRAFVLHDGQGGEVELDWLTTPVNVNPDTQAWCNLSLLGKSEQELEEVTHKAKARINKALEIEWRIDPDPAKELLQRARQRLILVLVIQELLSCLIHPEHQTELFYGGIYYYSRAATSSFYISKDGKIKFTPSPIVQLLEGIEVARVKECPICFKYFWAGRKDMICCSTKCASTHRMREYRKRYYTKI